MTTADPELRYQDCLATLQSRGQDHLLRWWNELTPAQRDHLLTEIERVPWDALDPLIRSHVQQKPARHLPARLAPAEVYPQPPRPGRESRYEEVRRHGRELLAAGKVAAFTVAGGQGTRLGVDGPKGCVPVTPVRGKTLFQLFAEMVKAGRDRYAVAIPWYIMTSPANHAQTVAYFESEGFFGLPDGDVILFEQGMLPLFSLTGFILLEAKHKLALGPDGHGGSLKALVKRGALDDMKARGVEIISYFQVDNPLVKPFDPLFIGLHDGTGSEMSIKVTPKADDLERVGNVCVADGKLAVIEYSDFPAELAQARSPDGRRRFDAANLAIHLFNVAFVERVIARSFNIPFRRAHKAVPFIDSTGTLVQPTEPNAIKLETFVFDVLPLAESPLVLEVDRAEEFSPVKNATGVDSLETSQRDQVRRACRWLEAAGVEVPRKANGEPDVAVVIAPALALEAEDLKRRPGLLPELHPGQELYVE